MYDDVKLIIVVLSVKSADHGVESSVYVLFGIVQAVVYEANSGCGFFIF